MAKLHRKCGFSNLPFDDILTRSLRTLDNWPQNDIIREHWLRLEEHQKYEDKTLKVLHDTFQDLTNQVIKLITTAIDQLEKNFIQQHNGNKSFLLKTIQKAYDIDDMAQTIDNFMNSRKTQEETHQHLDDIFKIATNAEDSILSQCSNYSNEINQFSTEIVSEIWENTMKKCLKTGEAAISSILLMKTSNTTLMKTKSSSDNQTSILDLSSQLFPEESPELRQKYKYIKDASPRRDQSGELRDRVNEFKNRPINAQSLTIPQSSTTFRRKETAKQRSPQTFDFDEMLNTSGEPSQISEKSMDYLKSIVIKSDTRQKSCEPKSFDAKNEKPELQRATKLNQVYGKRFSKQDMLNLISKKGI